MPEYRDRAESERCYVSGCDHPRYSHARRHKDPGGLGSPCCVACYNAGQQAIAWHEFLSENAG